MKKAFVVIAFSFSFQCLWSQVMWQFNLDTVITWNYKEGDEFNGSSIRTDYWNYVVWARSLYMNYEQQYYTEGFNHSVSNGTLKLTAKRENVFKRTIDSHPDNDSLFDGKKFITLNKTNFNYTSGKLTSKAEFNKGYFECRLKLPSQEGYWPAFWLYGGSPNEEIDMMESQTGRPMDIHVDTHCPNHCDMVWRFVTRESFGAWIKTKTNFAEGFNVVSCEWDENYVKFFLNGEFVAISKVKFNVPKHIAVNMAVPSDKGPFGPGPIEGKDSLATFEVDYVRVWSKETSDSKKPLQLSCLGEQDSTQKPTASIIIKKKSRSFYGNKKEANKEGIKITLLRQKNKLELTVLGNVRGIMPGIELSDSKGNVQYRQDLSWNCNAIDLSSLTKGSYNLLIKWNNKQTLYPVEIY